MKAAIYERAGTVAIQEVKQPHPPAGELLIKVSLCGICGTDEHIFSGELDIAKPPVVLGHEVCGQIVELGEGVNNFSVGDLVSIDPVVSCGQCEFCHSGRSNLCEEQTVIGYIRNGGFAEYMTAPASHVYALDSGFDPKAGILVETLACVLNGYDRLEFKAGHSALILGAGTVGLLWNQMLKSSLNTQLLQTEVVPFRREKAKKLGADLVLDGHDPNLKEKIFKVCPDGVDYIVDASGNPLAVEQAIPWVRKKGTFMIFGVCPQDAEIQISPFEIYEREMKIIASKMPAGTLDRAGRLLSSGRIDVDEIVTTLLPLEEIGHGFEMFEKGKGKAVKIAIEPGK